MKATQQLNEHGQSLWLDNITRDLLDSGTLKRYIAELSVTGLTSNPTIFDHAITHSGSYDAEIRQLIGRGLGGEDLFFELAIGRPHARRGPVRANSPAYRRPSTVGCRLRCRHCWPTTPKPR